MAEFEFREKIESWIEGIFDTLDGYIRTVFYLNFKPTKSIATLLPGSSENTPFSQPGTFMILSYIAMMILIKDVDFSDPVFSFNIAKTLDALGVLNAAKSIKIEDILIGVFPAILMLIFFVYLSFGVFYLFNEKIDLPIARRNYSYMLGNLFLLIGIVSFGYQTIVKPLSKISWWMGLLIHLLTLWPIFGALVASLPFILFYTFRSERRVRAFICGLLVGTLPWMILMTLNWYFSGNFSIIDYTRIR